MNVLVKPYGKVGYSMDLWDVGWICEHYTLPLHPSVDAYGVQNICKDKCKIVEKKRRKKLFNNIVNGLDNFFYIYSIRLEDNGEIYF